MTEFLTYQGKTAIALAVFYLFYRLLLSKETFHRFNRIVLLGTAALSFALPLCVITIIKVVTLPYTPVADEQAETVLEMATTVTETASAPVWPAIICGIFVLGALTVLSMAVISIFKVKAIINSGEHQTLESGETLVITTDNTAPFSWMKYIVISREDYESGYSQILTHEKAHIALRHSWDLLFVDMITALQWFNPAIWMLKSDLRALHEFEADDAVLRSGANIKEYQYLLIRKAVSKSGYSVANSFNHSTLKARITMMLNKKSSRMSVWKALYVIPLVGISLAATAETKVDYQYEGLQPEAVADTLKGKDSEKSFPEPENPFTKKNLREGRFIVDKENNTVTLIYFDNNCKELQVCYTGLDLNQNIYMHNGAIVTKEMQNKAAHDDPDAVLIVAYLKDDNRVSAAITTSGPYVSGKIDVVREQIEVNTNDLVIVVNGERMPEGFDLNTIPSSDITSMQVLKNEEALKEYEIDKGVIVITTDPSKKNEDKPVPDVYINGKKASSEDIAALPANPKGHVEADGTIWITTEENPKEEKKVTPFHQIAQRPTFNGGDANEFSKWVNQNLRYPDKCRQSKVQGRVTLQFTVTETGKVADVKVLRSVNPELDKEAARVVSESPDWTPGRNENGDTVPVTYTFPVIFRLPETTEENPKEAKKVVPFQHAAQKPTFNGGDANEFSKWVSENVRYPDKCRQSKVQGRVTLQFTVTETGKVADVKVLRSVNPELDKEAARVVSESPDWTPGRNENGEIVPVSYVFPVIFKLP